ncbi:MAG: D-ribose pyranase [Pseudomonadota bacterium]
MKSSGILNARLAGLIAGLGHTDTLVIADAGLPVPRGVELVDLAVVAGLPPFWPVLDAVRAEMVVEEAFVAEEATTTMADFERRLAVKTVSHEELKRMSAAARFVVRTGEATPYANIVLQAGVAF